MIDNRIMSGGSGVLAGFAVGGPIGAAVGLGAGLSMGTASNRSERDAAEALLRANIEQSWDIASQHYADTSAERESANSTYQQALGAARARFSASGGQLTGGSWQQVVGSLAKDRDSTLKELDKREEEFLNSEAYKFLEEDYQSNSRYTPTKMGGPHDDNYTVVHSLNRSGAGGSSFYTKDQYNRLRTETETINTANVSSSGQSAAYDRYKAAITPSFDEYRDFRLGGKDAKAAYSEIMDDRIESANTQYDREFAAEQATKMAAYAVYDRQDIRGAN